MSQQSSANQFIMSKQYRDILLFVGSMGILLSVFLLLASTLTLIKVSKLAVLCLLLCSSVFFYKGLAPQVQRRLRDNAKINLSKLWESLQTYRKQFVTS